MGRDPRELSVIMESFYTLSIVVMTWMQLFVKVHGSVHLKYEHSTAGKLYPNEVD